MKKLIIIASALFALSAFAADTTTTPPADTSGANQGAMGHDAGTMSNTDSTTTTKKHKSTTKADKKAAKGKMKKDTSAPADASAPAAQ